LRTASVGLICLLGLVAGCKEDTAASPPLARVRAVTAELTDFAPPVTVTGVVAARQQTALSFRVSGKMRERLVNPGEHVTANQPLARLDPDEQQHEIEAAKAGLDSAQALLRQSTASYERQRGLLATGNTTRRDYDQAEANMRQAQAQVEQARAQLASANDQLAYTVLVPGAPGIIVARSAEAGQVVAQAQPVYTLALDGPRDVIVNVNEWVLNNVVLDKGIAVALVSDPKVTAVGDVREISPAVDPSTMTISVKIGLRETPPTFGLGSLVNATSPMKSRRLFLLPWHAIFEREGKPAVWVVDKQSQTVSLKPVEIDRYTRDTIAVTGGIESGQTVVTAGGQVLRPGQKVEVVPERKP